MKKIAVLLALVLAFSVVSFVGCGSGPQSAGEEEALKGMEDDMGAVEDEAELDEGGGGDLEGGDEDDATP